MSIKKTKESLAQDIMIVLSQGESELTLEEYTALLSAIDNQVQERMVIVRESVKIIHTSETFTAEVQL